MMEVRPAGEKDALFLSAYMPCTDAVQLLEKDHTPIGAVRIAQGVLSDCFILPEWRNRGYGTFLLRRALQSRKNEPVAARTAPENKAGAALLRRCGFRMEAEEKGMDGVQRWRRILPHDDGRNALQVVRDFLHREVKPGAFAIDATAGNGHDTLFLCRLAGKAGRVIALDIQPQAVEATNRRLAENGFSDVGKAFADSHANLAAYAERESADAVVFNLGYLPGGDHAVFTHSEESIPAMKTALELLKKGGVMTVCAYSGGAQGTRERDAVLEFLENLPAEKFSVTVQRFDEMAGFPPVPVCIRKK